MLALRRQEIALLVTLAILLALFEGIGMGLLSPVLQYIQYGSSAVENGGAIWNALLKFADAVGMPITLLSLLILAFTPVLLRQGVFMLYTWYTAKVQLRATTRLREEGFAALVTGDLAFSTREGFGNLVSTLTAQVQRGGSAIFTFISLISTSLVILMYVLVLSVLDWRLTVIAVAALLVISWLVKGSITRSRALGRETADLNRESYSVIGERVGAIRLIKMLGQEEHETRTVKDVVLRLAAAQMRIAIHSGIIEITIDPLLMLTVFVIIYTGVQYFHASLADLGLFLFILLRLNTLSKAFNAGRQVLSSTIDSLHQVHDVIDRAKASRRILGGDVRFEGLQERILIDDVSFAYQDETEELVLKGVTVEIPCRSQTAIVGRSGAGKSTLVDLIPRLRDATSGRILFDGRPIGEFDLRSLRRSIGFMTQDALLFNDTIYSNLVYGLEREPSKEEVEHALRASYCSQFVYDLPSGLETVVGDRGVRLSGGQRQRLSLARVFLQDPDILILDEPTSALDSESEESIQKALAGVRHRKTLIVIAHRLSTVQRSDQIVVLDDGVIVERGTHAELLALEGAYRKLFDLQIYGKEPEPDELPV